ncbi:unnamed protein product [Parajaminaea phylloscopi]
MTDPAFPQEWREKGLEYKELKKLINGVVAELEGLGLSADVLRDLLEPPEESGDEEALPLPQKRAAPRRSRSRSGSAGGSESDHSEDLDAGLVAGLAKLSAGGGRPGPSDLVDPLSPLMEEEEARRHSIERGMNIPAMDANDMPGPALDIGQDRRRSSNRLVSPAGEYIASLNHSSPAQNRDRSRSRSRRENSSGASSFGHDADNSSRETSVQPSGADDSALSDEYATAEVTSDPRARPMKMLAADRSRRESSGEMTPEGMSPAQIQNWRMGKKDLEQLRRNSHTFSNRPSSSSDVKHGKQRASQSPEADQAVVHDWGGHAWRERQGLGWDSQQGAKNKGQPAAKPAPTPGRSDKEASGGHTRPKAARWVQGKDGRRARAEYELGGTPQHPIPRIRLTIESPINSDDEGNTEDGDGEDSDGRIEELPPSRRASVDTSAGAGGDASNAAIHQHAPANPPQLMRTRDIVIPLTADTQFLDTLTHSLTQLSELQSSQRGDFITSTEDLCASVARAASPYASKNDLYVWREIFQLWVDMQIFESSREKDRGELSVDESEARLQRFAQELVKRGWLAESTTTASSPRLSRNREAMESALTLPMKDSRSTSAVEDFLRLNLALLDVKKFQRVNVEAARKILKKHDKRTALTASSGLRNFVRQQESSRAAAAAAASLGMHIPGLPMSMGAESTGVLVAPAHGTHPSLAALLPSSTTGLLSESLPHILLSLLTTTLLPILPSVDDYSCAICTGLAWRPIRLDCGHLFCIRCLVKLQKQGKSHCPLCRAPNVVKTADGRNLDPATLNMLRMWFPNEISEKEAENERDRKKEELNELGFEQHKCMVM